MDDEKNAKAADNADGSDKGGAPRRQAVALKYDPLENSAPMVVGAGQGLLADRIIQQAEEHGVPIVEDPSLAKAMSALGLGDAIPPELYEVVAQILVFVGTADKDYARWRAAAQGRK